MFGIVDHDKSIRTSAGKGAPLAVYPLTPWTNGYNPSTLRAPLGATFARIYAVGGGGGGYYGGQGGGGGGTGIWEGPCSPGDVFTLSVPSLGGAGYDGGGPSTAGGDAICSRNGVELCAGLGGKGTASSGGGKGGGWRGMFGANGGDGGADGVAGGSSGGNPGGAPGNGGGGGASLIGQTVSSVDYYSYAWRPQFGAGGSGGTAGAPGGYLFIFY